jgi:DNA-binding transcriptional regulator YiaG
MEVSTIVELVPMKDILSSFQTTANSVLCTPFFELFSSSLFFSSSGTKEFARTIVNEEHSVPSQVHMILDSFGLSKSDLAKILGVTRPALYAWLDGKSEPNVENLKRLHAIYSIIKAWPNAKKQPLFHAYIERPVGGNSHSLIELLSASSIDVEQVRALLRVIQSMTAEREIRIGKDRTMVESASNLKDEQEQILEDNLLAITAEE